MTRGRAQLFALLLGLTIAARLPAQTLAHKGWAGSGMTVEPWWQHAVFYRIDPLSFQDSNGDGYGDLNGITARLPYLDTLGVDAILLSPFELEHTGAEPFDSLYGTAEDFDRLEQEAARLKIRIVVDLPLRAADTPEQMASAARFWLTRGVGGLRITQALDAPALSPAQLAEKLRALRGILASFRGERVLLSDQPSPTPDVPLPRAASRRQPAMARADLTIDLRLAQHRVLDAQALRELLLQQSTTSFQLIESDAPDFIRSDTRLAGASSPDDADLQARLLATVLFTSRDAPLLDFGQELGMASRGTDPSPMQWGQSATDHGFSQGVPWVDEGPNEATHNAVFEDADPDSILNWYRKLAALRHTSAALNAGSFDLLASPNPDLVLWLRRARGSAPVLVVVNASARYNVLSLATLTPQLKRLGVESESRPVHTLATTSPELAKAISASSLALPAGTVWIGEVQPQAGLESIVLPAHHSRH